ncbi:hypothetical protein WJX72_006067 [[Myrmecia] bisecta]|uniref:Uncharacterized protein n=1 Tax=[Myrmecia] bisecta TaxID=41462 RepID=A0AAW1PGG0_9CHLO
MASAKQPLLDQQGRDALEDQIQDLVENGTLHDEASPSRVPDQDDDDRTTMSEESHYSDRAPWLRAAVLGANDGLVSVASIMLGVGASDVPLHTLLLSGLSALVAGALSMAAGEYISVASQRDTEQADVNKERAAQLRGPKSRRRELEELVQIYVDRGLDRQLAKEVAVALSQQDVVRTHARDELGIDVDEMVSPTQAAISSAVSFTIGAAVPLLASAFIHDSRARLVAVGGASTIALALFGAIGAWLGGAHKCTAATRVLVGGWLAMAITFGVGRLFGQNPE